MSTEINANCSRRSWAARKSDKRGKIEVAITELEMLGRKERKKGEVMPISKTTKMSKKSIQNSSVDPEWSQMLVSIRVVRKKTRRVKERV